MPLVGGSRNVPLAQGSQGLPPNNSIDNPRLADMAQATIKGRASGAGTGDPTDLTAAQLATILAGQFGAVPDVQVFTANGNWDKPAAAKWVRVICIGGGGG